MTRRRCVAMPAVVAMCLIWFLAACSNNTGATRGSAGKTAATSPRVTVAMVTHGQSFDPFWVLVRKGAEQAASDFNVTLRYQSPTVTNPQAQASLITEAAQAKPDAMVVTIPDATLSSAIRRVSSSAIPVIAMNVGDSLYQQVGALTFVGQEERTAGAEAGKEMAAARVRRALCVIHEERNTALTDRCAGFAKQLAASGASVQVLHVNGARLSDAKSSIEQALRRNPGIDGVLATGIIGFNAAGGAMNALKVFGKVKLGTFDASAADLTAVQNGQALFVIDQQPFLEGYDAVQVAGFQVRYGQHPFRPIYTGPSVITKANAAKVAELYKTSGIPLFRGGYR